MFGKTGTGKSTLCNVLAGKEYDADYFPTSSDPTSCTQETKFANVFLNGDLNKPVSLIDTIGFDDPTKDHDATIIAELVVTLNTKCDYVNLFVLAVNGQNPRLDGSLLTMIRILEGMFSKDFWNQIVLVFTRMPMSLRDKERREKINKKTDAQLAAEFIKVVEKKFKDCSGLRYLYMDATYEKNDGHEKDAFDSACIKLHEMLEKLPGLPTENIKKVETDNELLQQKIKEKEAETETLQAQVKKLKADAEAREENEKMKQKAEKAKIKERVGEAIGMVFLGTVVALACIPLGPAGIAVGLASGVKIGATVGGLIPIAWEWIANVFSKRPGKLNLYFNI